MHVDSRPVSAHLPATLSEPPHGLTALVDRFVARRVSEPGESLTEARLRTDFIDPFVRFLGWDVDNRAGAPEAYREVIVHPAGPPGDNVFCPDYELRIGGLPQFIIAVQRPGSSHRSRAHVAFRLRSHAWNARLPLAILTDFEELSIYDTRAQPRPSDAAQVGRIQHLTCDQYVARWHEMSRFLGKSAIGRGAIARYTGADSPKHSAATVDRHFLATLHRWRAQLAGILARRQTSWNQRQLGFAVHRAMDLIIFLRVCEARGLQPPYALRAALAQLDIPDDALRSLFSDLYPPSPYDFSVFPADVLGSVYERFLGGEIHIDCNRSVTVKDKPTVRKSGGVYYTPRAVVRYIAASVLRPLLRGKQPGPHGEVSRMRLLDPACGSGAFLLEMFQYLLDWHIEQYVGADATTRSRYLYRDARGRWQLFTAEKLRILRNNIYGVDIDPHAVEVTKLSLLLKVLEHEGGASARLQPPQDFNRLLPDLGQNVQCGDSLIPHVHAHMRVVGNGPSDADVEPFAWTTAFPDILQSGGFDAVVGNPPYFRVDEVWGKKDPRRAYLKEHYAQIYNDKTDILFYFLQMSVQLARHRVAMLVSRAFLEAYKADKLRGWLAASTRIVEILDFRNHAVFQNAGIATAIVHLLAERDKELDRKRGPDRARIRTLRDGPFSLALLGDERILTTWVDEIAVAQEQFSAAPWLFAHENLQLTLQKIDAHGQPAGEVLHVGQGMQTGFNQAFTVSPRAAQELCGPAVQQFIRARNSDIRAFHVHDSGQILLYVEDCPRFDALPGAVREHLSGHQSRLRARAAHRRGNCAWWRYTWPLHSEYVATPRILCPYLARSNRFALDRTARFLGLTDTTVLYRGDHKEALEYFLGILNTRMMTVRLRYLAKFKGNGLWEYFDNVLSRLPLRRIDFANLDEVAAHDAIVAMVRDIEALAAREGDRSPQLASTRAQLESAVRALYQLDADDERNLDTDMDMGRGSTAGP